MRFWTRELAGWLLILLGLWVFYQCYAFLREHYLVEAGELIAIGFIIFRGGIHLPKVAVAARVCMAAQQTDPSPRVTRRPAEKVLRPTPWPYPPQRSD